MFDICKLGLSKNLILFSFPQKDMGKHNLSTMLILLSEYRFCIWTSRNKIRYEKKHQSPFEVASQFITRVKSRIQIDFQRLPIVSFHDIWLHDTICSFENGQIKFNFN